METPTFTESEMIQQSSKVWAAVKLHGRAVIKSQDGDEFAVTAEPAWKPHPPGTKLRVPDFAAYRERMRKAGLQPLPPELDEWFNRIVAGED